MILDSNPLRATQLNISKPKMKPQLLLTSLVALAAVAPLSGQNLLIDFNSTSQDAGPHPQVGYQSYDAGHEVIADFITVGFPAFGTTINITPAWPNTTANTAQQMIDRGAGNDNNWDNAAGDLDLVTDFLGIDTRTANGGNGNWDGAVGTPTSMTLTIAGLPATTYGWSSFHHDTEHVHTNFQIELSTDDGDTFTNLGTSFYMSDSTAGGNPDSAADGGGGVQVGPDALTLSSTANFEIEASGEDIVLRFTPFSGVLGNAVHNQIWGINGFQLVALSDADGDGLADSYEQQIIEADPNDAITTLQEVIPGDDFDNDGSTNEQERDNNTDPTNDDTDGDGLLDGAETNTGTFLNSSNTGTNPIRPDSDGDSISDGDEVIGVSGFVTDPNKSDSDADGFDDDVEIAASSDPTDINSVPASGGISILFIGGQAGPTQGADGAVMTYLQDRYGPLSVTYQAANATPAGDENAYDVLIISSTPGSGDMRNKFHNSTTPAINWEEATADSGGGEYGMSSLQMTKSQTMTMLDLAEHPITTGLPSSIDFNTAGETTNTTDLFAGLTAVATAANGTGSAGPGNGLDITGNPALFVAEVGDAVNPGSGITGGIAPSRRVMFPMTDNTFNNLTDDGKTLFGQSIDWLLGISGGPVKLKLTDVSYDNNASTLSISWESEAGKLYNLRSTTDPASAEPKDWPIFGGKMDLVATSPENTVTIAHPAEATRLFVVEEFDAPPVTIESYDFEAGAEGWTTESVDEPDLNISATQWELGPPLAIGPSAAHSGTNCFGTDLDADYDFDTLITLRSPAIDLSTLASASVTFWQWLDVEEGFDEVAIRLLDAANGNAEIAVLDSGIDGISADWEEVTLDFPPEANGKTVILEFLFDSDNIGNFAGYYLDDVSVQGPPL
jgi:hypothetical protein